MSDTQFNYYQPLSHALNPPRNASQSEYFKPPPPEQSKQPESDDDDEGTVEEQLSRTSLPSSPKQQSSHFDRQPSSTQDPEPRRRGRPRGSKNRRGRIPSTPTVKSPSNNQPVHPTGQGTNPPQLPEVTPQNQQYYEFQWRVLNLCAEFYGAAEELVKATPALVIAQCYQMGPNSKVDPLNMLSEAKQICDTLLANPSRLITSPPPPMYPVVPTFYAPSSIPTATTTTTTTTAAPTVISQPQSFVVSMGNPTYPAVYATTPPQYPTASYYQYPYGHPGAYYAAPPPPAAPPPASSGSSAPAPQVQPSNAGNSGPWSDEETEQLKKLADEKKTNTGDIDWDQVVNEWGNTRSRHQILIKATQLGLKESSSGRGIKRRREADNNPDAVASTSAAPTPGHSSSTPTSTPIPSPSLQNQQQPHISKPPLSVATAPPANQPWPMPVVAVNTVSSPVIGSSNSSSSDHRVTSYYRPRPTASPKPAPANQQQPLHRYIYQTNGHHSDNPK